MFSITKLIANIIPLSFVAAIMFGFLDLSVISFFAFGKFSILSAYSLIFFGALAFILIADFIKIGIPGMGVIWMVLILSSFALQNWIIGLIAGIISLILSLILGIKFFSPD